MSFDWNDLRFFLAVARTGRLTVAARMMGTDHATVSRRVRALELQLGTQLFERSPRGYALSEHGERLLAHAEKIENAAAKVQDDLSGTLYALSGTVRIGAPDGFGAFFLAPRLADFAVANPELEVQLVATPRQFSLSKREADLVISLDRPEKGRLVTRKLTDYTLHLYATQDYLDRSPPLRRKEDLSEHLLIGYISELIFTPELDYLPAVAENDQHRFSSTNLFAQMRAAEAGKGVCVLPDFMACHSPALVPVLPRDVELKRSYWLLTHQDQREIARVRAAMSFVAEQVGRARAEFLPEIAPPAQPGA
ncbi:LysR family transcriptional regulator [Thioclava atlantica]|uniref:LysR family transcriptional regulator n=1 Tax=Thioclava atlantica TaxID=1317124 RepID=A0A085TV95_9RHOB|nr:LysR family transcriptional regulator [Thioclava atlantica]KFE34642.1 LysR family transcriptional regulator [Thioclava atlantica]